VAVRECTVARLTITIPDDLDDRLAELSDKDGPYESKANAVRELTRRGERLPEVERERDQLRDQLAAVNARQDDVGELVEYVEREKALQQRERERRDAPAWRRAKWWLLGRG
jgi:Arc/MetJ-type ribon-helix-helix transcriptional regulator